MKCVEATSYAKLNAVKVATFIKSRIIYRYGAPHELILDKCVHFKGEVDVSWWPINIFDIATRDLLSPQ